MSGDSPRREGEAADAAETPGRPIVIKKYANRRLYNTGSSSYVTLDDLAVLVRSGTDFVVFDAKTGEDITRQVLTQIIFEAESAAAGGQGLLPVQFLRQLIRLYGDQMQSFVPSYLEMSLDAFSRQGERLRDQMAGAFGAAPGYAFFEDQVRQNFALFEKTLRAFTPVAPARPEPSARSPAGASARADELDELRSQIEAMRRQLDRLSKD